MSAARPTALITGASRGIGRGVALALARIGATVYVAGRSDRDGVVRVDEATLPGTIGAAARAVDEAGGRGIAVRCDMADDAQIAALFDEIRRHSGGLDLLVNNAAFLHDDIGSAGRFWERSARLADIIDVGLRCHYLATRAAVPLMAARGGGLVANISFYGGARMHDPAYYAAKAGLDALAATMAPDLRTEGITAVSLWPGMVATERVQMLAKQLPEVAAQMSGFETPDFVGRVIAALYADPDRLVLTGKTLIVAELARRYAIVEADGRQPVSYRSSFGAPKPEHDVPELAHAGTATPRREGDAE